jgi:hypothetical protein
VRPVALTHWRRPTQKSIVVLSPLLHAHFFKRLIKLVGHLYFKRGPSVLATAAADIRSWYAARDPKSIC